MSRSALILPDGTLSIEEVIASELRMLDRVDVGANCITSP